MVIKLRERSQITLPVEIVKKLNIKTGDSLEVKLEDDKIGKIWNGRQRKI